MVVSFHQGPRFFRLLMFQMVAGALVSKSIRKEEETKSCALLLLKIAWKFPQYFILHVNGQNLHMEPHLATREAGISNLLDEYVSTSIKLSFCY